MPSAVEIWECPHCGHRLDISALGFYAEVRCPGCGKRARVHTLLANFRIEGILGIGGMSVVLRARDLVLNRPLAIKVLNETYRNQPERIARFEKECALMAQVRHENVVSVYSAGRARGQFYIAMELVEGSNLELMVAGGHALPPSQALEITRQVTQGLDAAHRAGLLHRDMKPGNVLITREGKAKVLDFGLSLGDSDKDTEEIIWATPFYVSPETLQRQPEDVRTDIYALGMTLRCLLTGVEEFPENPQTPVDILRCKARLGRISGGMLDASLRDLVAHMTAFSPSRRPSDYAELLAELEEVQAFQQRFEQEQTPRRLRLRRKQRALCLGGAVVLGGLSALLVAWLQMPPPIQSCVRPESVPEIDGAAGWLAAHRAMERGEWGQAADLFRQLSESVEEPALGAWSALMAYALADAERDESAKAAALHLLQRHCDNKEDVSPAGRDSLGQVERIRADLSSPSSSSKPDEPAITLPALQGIFSLLRFSSSMEQGEGAEAEALLAEARRAFSVAPPPYSSLVRLADELEEGRPARLRESLQRQVKEALQGDDTSRAIRKIQALAGGTQALEQNPQLRAQKEICEVAGEVFSLLKRRRSTSYQPGMSPKQLRDLAQGLGSEHFPEEVFSLACLLRGEIDQAFKSNPYREQPDSREPFAILMRSWKAALLPK